MKPLLLLLLGLAPLLVVASAWAGSSAESRQNAATDYVDRLVENISGVTELLPRMIDLAQRGAEHLAKGGALWLAGDKAFVLEGLNRAGGTMAAKWLKDPSDVASGDLVLFGATECDAPEHQTLLQACSRRGTLVVLFGPDSAPSSNPHFLPIPATTSGGDLLPTIYPALAAGLWAYTGELVAALTRLGKMPPMYQSVLVPGGRERNAVHLKRQWEPETIAPIKPGILGRTYLARISNDLKDLRASQSGGFARAGQLAARAIADGKTVWCEAVGHMPPEILGKQGDPGICKQIRYGNAPDKLEGILQPGDVVLYVGYYEPFGPWVSTVHRCGGKIVTVVSGTPDRPALAMGADVNIDPQWPFGDVTVDVPGYDTAILPPSGVIQCAAYYMLLAQTQQAVDGP